MPRKKHYVKGSKRVYLARQGFSRHGNATKKHKRKLGRSVRTGRVTKRTLRNVGLK